MLRISIQRSNFCIIQSLQKLTIKKPFNRLCCLPFKQVQISQRFCDKVTDRVYYGPLTPQIKAVKVFSLSSSVAGLIIQPLLVKEASTIGSTSLLVAICSVVGFFTFITPILLHFVTKKYVMEVHYNPENSTYTATTLNFFLRKKQTQFTPDDVEVPEIPGMFTSFKAKGQPLFVEVRHFSDPRHYAKIMGYDKPMDFKLGSVETDEQKNK